MPELHADRQEKTACKTGKVLSRSGKTKNIGLRVTPDKYAAVERVAELRGLNIQKTVEGAIDAMLANAGLLLPQTTVPKPPRRGSIHEQLETILEKLTGIENKMGIGSGESPITSGDIPSATLEHGRSGGIAEVREDLTEFFERHDRDEKLPPPAKADRSAKQKKTPRTGTDGGKH
jgi:hypothetical protein